MATIKTTRSKRKLKTATATTKPVFKSKFEEEIARSLDRLKVEYAYEPTKLRYAVLRDYKPDFVLSNGIYIETKGYFKSDDQRKMRAIKDQHPEIDIRMVFQRLAGRVQGSKMTNAEWCDKYGFQYADGKIPREWIYE